MNSPIKPNATFSQDVQALAKAPDKKSSGPMGQQVAELAQDKKLDNVPQSIAMSNKKQLNAAIIESSLKFSSTISDQPLSLVLKTALQGINEALESTGINETIEEVYESGVDYTPEATAQRIVSFSTGFLSAYREQHPEMSADESLSAFIDVINGGIEQGFSEARAILSGFDVLDGQIAENIDKTYDFVQQGLIAFVDDMNLNNVTSSDN